MLNLSSTVLNHVLIAYPDIKDQIEIAGALDTLEDKLSVIERKQAALQDLFRTLLHQLMTGQVRVGDAI